VDVHGLVVAVELAAPDPLNDDLAGLHLARVEKQQGKKVKLLGREVQLLAVDVDGAGAAVDPEVVQLLDLARVDTLLSGHLRAP